MYLFIYLILSICLFIYVWMQTAIFGQMEEGNKRTASQADLMRDQSRGGRRCVTPYRAIPRAEAVTLAELARVAKLRTSAGTERTDWKQFGDCLVVITLW